MFTLPTYLHHLRGEASCAGPSGGNWDCMPLHVGQQVCVSSLCITLHEPSRLPHNAGSVLQGGAMRRHTVRCFAPAKDEALRPRGTTLRLEEAEPAGVTTLVDRGVAPASRLAEMTEATQEAWTCAVCSEAKTIEYGEFCLLNS